MIADPCAPRVRFREIAADDADLVVRWRNSASAREVFYSQSIVTPDTHRAFVAARKPHDLIWIVEVAAPSVVRIGTLSLTVDPESRTGEYGRAFLDESCRGRGLWREIEALLEHYAFAVLGLREIWLDIIAANQRMIDIHLRGGWVVRREVHHHGQAGLLMVLDAAAYRAKVETPRAAPSPAQDVPPVSATALLHRAVATAPDRDAWDA